MISWLSLGLGSFGDSLFLSFFRKKIIYLLIWLCWVLVIACRIFSWGVQTLGCGMWDLVS